MTSLEGHRLTNLRLPDGSRPQWRIEGGRITRAGGADEAGAPVLDLGDRLVLPGLIEGHVHLDKTLLGAPWQPHAAAAGVRGRVAFEKEVRRRLDVPVETRADALLHRCLQAGVTRLRTHVDLDELVGLDNLHAVLRVREAWRGRIDIEIVAFPQSGILACPPARELMAEALAQGADLVGGLDPVGFDGDRDGHLDAVFALAESRGCGIDIHLHDGGAVGLGEIEDIAARTRAAGLGGRVTISHAFALGDADAATLERVAASLAASGVSVLTSVPAASSCPPLPVLRERGVAVFLGTDNVRDAWSPYTTIGPIERAMLAAYQFGLRTDTALAGLLDHVTAVPAAIMGLPPPLAEGSPADFIVLDAEHVPQVVVERLRPDIVVKDGRIVLGAAPAPRPDASAPA